MESSFQLMIAYDMFYYVKFTALSIKTICRALPLIVLNQSVNFGRHLTEILYPFEISYQIFIHTLPYQYLSFRNFTLPKFSFEKSYLTKIFFSEMLRNFTIIKVSVNRLYVNVTLRKLR